MATIENPMRRRASARVRLALLILGAGLAPTPALAEAEPTPGSKRLAEIFAQTFESYLELDPVNATAVGESRYNHRLTFAFLPTQRAARRTLFEEARTLLATVERDELSERERLYADAFEYWLTQSLEGLAFPDHLLPFWPGRSLPSAFPQMASGRGLHPFRTVDDYDDFLSRIGDFERWIDGAIVQLRRGVEAGVVHPRSMLEKALPELSSHASGAVEKIVFYRPIAAMPERFPAEQRNRLAAAYRQAIAERVMPAYRRFVDFLRREYLPACRATISFSELPGGAEWYRHLVRFYTTTERARRSSTSAWRRSSASRARWAS